MTCLPTRLGYEPTAALVFDGATHRQMTKSNGGSELNRNRRLNLELHAQR